MHGSFAELGDSRAEQIRRPKFDDFAVLRDLSGNPTYQELATYRSADWVQGFLPGSRPSNQHEELRGRQLRTLSMRLLIFLGAASLGAASLCSWAAKPAPWPPQLEMRVPFEPTAFPSGPHFYVMYELHLTNFGTTPLSLSRIDVLDADAGAAQPIATFEADQLKAMLQPLGGKTLSDPKERLIIADGQSAIAFMSVAFDRSSHIPDRLLHQVSTVDSAAEGAVIATHHPELHVLGPPVEGANWLAADRPRNV